MIPSLLHDIPHNNNSYVQQHVQLLPSTGWQELDVLLDMLCGCSCHPHHMSNSMSSSCHHACTQHACPGWHAAGAGRAIGHVMWLLLAMSNSTSSSCHPHHMSNSTSSSCHPHHMSNSTSTSSSCHPHHMSNSMHVHAGLATTYTTCPAARPALATHTTCPINSM